MSPTLHGKPRSLYRKERIVLDYLFEHCGGAYALEIVNATGVEFGSVHRVLRSLESFGFVIMTEIEKGECPKIGRFHPRWYARITEAGLKRRKEN